LLPNNRRAKLFGPLRRAAAFFFFFSLASAARSMLQVTRPLPAYGSGAAIDPAPRTRSRPVRFLSFDQAGAAIDPGATIHLDVLPFFPRSPDRMPRITHT
jgi:hypothetical protein